MLSTSQKAKLGETLMHHWWSYSTICSLWSHQFWHQMLFVLLQNNSVPLLTCRTCLGKKAIPGQGGSFFISITQIWRWRWWNVMIGEWENGWCSNEIEPYKVPLSSSSWFRNDQKQVFLTRTWREKQKLCNLPRWKEQRRTDRGDHGLQ